MAFVLPQSKSRPLAASSSQLMSPAVRAMRSAASRWICYRRVQVGTVQGARALIAEPIPDLALDPL